MLLELRTTSSRVWCHRVFRRFLMRRRNSSIRRWSSTTKNRQRSPIWRFTWTPSRRSSTSRSESMKIWERNKRSNLKSSRKTRPRSWGIIKRSLNRDKGTSLWQTSHLKEIEKRSRPSGNSWSKLRTIWIRKRSIKSHRSSVSVGNAQIWDKRTESWEKRSAIMMNS